MNGIFWAAAILAASVLVFPHSSRRRLAVRATHPDRCVRPMAITTTLAVSVVAAVNVPLTTLVAAAMVMVALVLRIRRRTARRRIADEGRAMTGALDVLAAELRVGAHPVRAFEAAAADAAEPVGTAMWSVAARAELGADVAAGLRAAGLRSGLGPEWERLAVSWRLAAEHGLAIATLMRAAQLDIVARQRFSNQVDTSMAGARATAAILAGLPVLGVAMGEAMGAGPIAFLAGGGIGGWFLVAGTSLLGGGLWWSDRITGRLAR